MLRLVHPDDGSNTPSRRHHHPSASLFLTADEARHVHAAIRGASRTYGSMAKLARVLGVKPNTLTAKHPSAAIAIAVARLTGLSLDSMLAGRLTEAGVCPVCGGKRAGGAA
jgi:hypothetical protein